MDLYLITGFLGAGKTTCIKNLLKIWQDKKIGLIVNEFGKQGVDGKLLETEGVLLEEINNGSIFCTCKINRFESVLEELMANAPDVILIEASGLSDPTSAYEIMQREQFQAIHYKGCICIVDAIRFVKVIHTAKVSRRQIRMADQVIINKTDLASETMINEVTRTVAFYNPDVVMYQTTYGQIESVWLEKLGIRTKQWDEEALLTRDITLQRYALTISEACTLHTLKKMLASFIEDTYRIKGFVVLEGEKYLVDCVGDLISIKTYENDIPPSNVLVVLAGEGMPLGKSLKRTEELYCNHLLKIEK